MRRAAALAALVMVLAAVAAACGGSDEGSTGTTATAEATFDTEAALVALSDLPEDWTRDPQPDDAEQGEFCGERVAVDELEESAAEFSEDRGLPQIESQVNAYAPGDAVAAMADARTILDGCEQFIADTRTWDVAEIDFPALGDESIARLLTTEVEGVDLGLYAIFIRVGDGIASFGYAGVDPSPREAARFARVAEQNLRAAQQ